MNEKPDIEIRRKIYNLIKKNPGLHAKKISEILRISGQLTDYHLLYLERLEVIKSIKEAGYRRYYISGKISIDDRKKLALFRQEIPLKIILVLLKYETITHKELMKFFDIAASTLSYHLKKLIKKDLVDYTIKNNQKKYKLVDIENVKKLLIKYKPYSWVDNFTDAWSDFKWK